MTEQVSAAAPHYEAPLVIGTDATPPIAWRPVLITAAVVAAVITAVSWRIGAYSNELYFIGAGGHPAWGYVDQPPLTPVLAHGLWSVAHSLVLLRLPATLCMVAMVVLSALTARELGGERRAQTVAALTTATSILLLSLSATLATTAIDSALWATVLWLVARWNRLRQDRLLLVATLVTAVALENKYLIVSLWAVLIVAVLVSGPRELLRRPLLWIGGAVAILSAVPGLLWQASHGWPQIEMTSVIAAEAQRDAGGRLGFLPLVLFYAGIPVGVALAVRGVVRLWRIPAHRFLGITVGGVVLVFLIADGRHTYTGGLLPMVYAAGSIDLRGRVWRVVAGAPGLILATLIAVPLSLSVLPVSTGAQVNILTRGSTGWPELVDTVAAAYRSAGPGPVALVADTYRQAGALDAYGESRGLPKASSPDRGYSAFGPPADEVTTVLWVGDRPPAEFRAAFAEVREAARFDDNPDGYLGINSDVPVWLCTGFHDDWQQLWPRIKHYESRDRVAA